MLEFEVRHNQKHEIQLSMLAPWQVQVRSGIIRRHSEGIKVWYLVSHCFACETDTTNVRAYKA